MTPLWQAHGWCPLRRLPEQGSRLPHCPALCRRPGAVCPLRCSVLAGPGFPRAAPLMTDQVLKLHFRLWGPLLPGRGPSPAPLGPELRSRQVSQLVGIWCCPLSHAYSPGVTGALARPCGPLSTDHSWKSTSV